MLTEKDKKFLLNLSRALIENKESNLSDIPQNLLQKASTFITILSNEKDPYSVGSLNTNIELYQDVMDHSISLSNEIKNPEEIKIEISVIKNMQKLSFDSEEDLFRKIIPNIHGVVIKKENKLATLLPFVWAQIPDKREFLNQICKKMGLHEDSWKENADILVYEAETFREL